MTVSVWRYSHLALAVSSFVFIVLAAVTGIILAFEPVSHRLQPYAVTRLDEVTLAQTLAAASGKYDEILEIKIEKGLFVQADVITQDGESAQIYLNPRTGESLGAVQPENEFFQWVTTLHRSLFLHGLGRFFMGLTAFLLLLIAITGSILVVKRQRKLKLFFAKVVRENGLQFYHVVFGRIWLVPILIIAATGAFLTLDAFELLDKSKPDSKIDFDNIKVEPQRPISEFPAFRQTKMSEVVSVEFPFSPDPEDVFTVKCHDRDWVVNQFTGDILSETKAPSVTEWINLSLDLHTGRASILWALVLAIACLNILFFVYSGFAMTLKRRSGKTKNPYTKDQAEFVILAGSENGSTMRFAKALHTALLASGAKSYFAELNRYETFESVRHLIVLTATYGIGEPPTNAGKALSRMARYRQTKPFTFSVVGFGSHAYPDFCRFAFEIYNTLSHTQNASPLLEIETINDKSTAQFSRWVTEFGLRTHLELSIDTKSLAAKPVKRHAFTVVSKTQAQEGQAFLIRLCPVGNPKFNSGDLLTVFPADDARNREYSIGKVDNLAQLSVKLHPNGLGSGYLYNLQIGDTIKAALVRNREFHLPSKAKQVVLVSNGTGIAPFLGMIAQNKSAECHLFAGFRSAESFMPYDEFLQDKLQNGQLKSLHLAYSREGNKQYVKDVLAEQKQWLGSVLALGGVVMICGSLAMQNQVLEWLESVAQEIGKTLAELQSGGQIKMDCY